MVYRIFVEKKKGFNTEADSLLSDIRSFLGVKSLAELRIFNRYDVENIEAELFDSCIHTVFSEPQTDTVTDGLSIPDGCTVFACEYLPGQFDQRADSAEQCVQLISRGERPTVRTARVFVLYGGLSETETDAIKKYVINPVESREASLDKPDTLELSCETPGRVPVIEGFRGCCGNMLQGIIREYGLAMDLADIECCRQYFAAERRDPTLTELRMIDTYWSDHCRHTTFSTQLDNVRIDHKDAEAAYEAYLAMREELGIKKPQTLMDIATIGAKYLKRQGKLRDVDESEEVNACSVAVEAEIDGKKEPWLLMFKNETHNHPTEIEPFGGAATCIGGAIRDPLSGRSYVYHAMRVTGAGDPLVPVEQTLPGKLPQRKIVTTAAEGYSSYGNQIGIATGLVDELYHPGYVAKRMEIGMVIGAAPKENVVRKTPSPGDAVLLLGGRTGRDGCGGATGSSKSHSLCSLEECGAEVQKGNAPEERKIQRLFRNPKAARLIKRCNDFGAGGVSVAIGELADGLSIDLDAVPKKYDGLSGTELAISESQERMAVLVGEGDAEEFMALAAEENLEATVVARVTEEPRLKMTWNGDVIVDISRRFLNSNGAARHTDAHIEKANAAPAAKYDGVSFKERLLALAGDLNVCSKRGLAERFDSTIGAASVLMPFGGKHQRTPAQAMAAKLPAFGSTDTCSVAAYGYNPFITEKSPYHGAYLAVVESLSKLAATGADMTKCWLTFQEYFGRPGVSEERWGRPLAALLGALSAQTELGFAAIGGKDSMSGSFEDMDVPPTLVSFAVAAAGAGNIISPEFKRAGSKVVLIAPKMRENGLPEPESYLECVDTVSKLIREKKALSVFTPVYGGIAAAVLKMCLGNRTGFEFDAGFPAGKCFEYSYGSFIAELEKGEDAGVPLGRTLGAYSITGFGETVELADIEKVYDGRLESVFPTKAGEPSPAPGFEFTQKGMRTGPKIRIAKPRVVIPVFPGTNCEYDTARAFTAAGALPEILVVRNISAADVAESVKRFADAIKNSQIVFIPGGFSGGDEPDGSGKFITAFFRNPLIKERIEELLSLQDGLIGGICNGFQALIKLGLVPFGHIGDADKEWPTLTFNTIGRHQSRLARVRVASNMSPWLMHCNVGDVHISPVSHGEGRFICSEELVAALAEGGQIATQYADMDGEPSMDIDVNPNGSAYAVEGITSPDGRVFGKMAHSERNGANLYKNVEGQRGGAMFAGAVDYYV